MGRRIAACAVLMALMVSLAACQCNRAAKPAAGKPGASGGTVCVTTPCVKGHDCTACYKSEADKDMGRRKDDLPPGGCCCCPETTHGHTTYADPCAPCGK